MKTSIGLGFSFLLGFGAGGYFTYMYVKEKFENISREEIDSIKNAYAEKVKNLEKECESDGEKKKEPIGFKNDKSDILDYKKRVKESGYTNYSDITKGNDDSMRPYVIAPEEYGENDEYDTISLTYYLDAVLVDENDEVITNPEELVGNDFSSHFGEYEDDSVFIRNDIRKLDVEILMDYRAYKDVLSVKPHLEE